MRTNKKSMTKKSMTKKTKTKKAKTMMMTSMPIMMDFLFNHCSNNSTHHKSSTQSNLLLWRPYLFADLKPWTVTIILVCRFKTFNCDDHTCLPIQDLWLWRSYFLPSENFFMTIILFLPCSKLFCFVDHNTFCFVMITFVSHILFCDDFIPPIL